MTDSLNNENELWMLCAHFLNNKFFTMPIGSFI